MGRASRTNETLPEFHSILGPEKRGLNGVVSGYPTSMNLLQVDGLSTDPWDLRHHKSNIDGQKNEQIQT